MKQSLCNGWEFTPQWTEVFGLGKGTAQSVRLPHTAEEMPLHYGDSDTYQMVCGYRRTLIPDASMASKRLFLQFDGAAHIATVYLNGQALTTHRCGYTAFRVEITDQIRFDEENLIAVKLDTTENPKLPPFGFAVCTGRSGWISGKPKWSTMFSFPPRICIPPMFPFRQTVTVG